MLKNQDVVYNKFKKYKSKKTKRNYKSLCSLKEIKLNNVQRFLGEYINKQDRLILFHGIGSGKTLTIIHMCESADEIYDRCWIVTQASLIDSFYEEIIKYDIIMRRFKYITKEEYKEITEYQHKKQNQTLVYNDKRKYNKLMKTLHSNINKNYRLFSYERFCKYPRYDMTDSQILVIDEVQNILGQHNPKFYKIRYDIIQSENYCKRHFCQRVRIILSSATPITDDFNDFFQLLKLLSPREKFDYKIFKNKKIKESVKIEYLKKLIKFISEHVSYYEPANTDNLLYPKQKLIIERCVMSNYQYKKYLESGVITKYNRFPLTNSFLIGPRLASNFVYPELGYGRMTIDNRYFADSKLKDMSCKLYKLLYNIKRTKKNKIVIYSNFTNEFGIKAVKRMLDIYGYVNYRDVYFSNGIKDKYVDVPNYSVYATFTGSDSDTYRQDILKFFNAPENKDGKNMKILLLSPAGKEGLTLLGVREIHILEPYWNKARIKQIEGRGFRACSHRYLPPNEREIKTFLYLAVFDKNNDKDKKDLKQIRKGNVIDYIKNIESVDDYIYKIQIEKERKNKEFIDLLKLNSLDCKLFKTVNGIEKCQKKDFNMV